MLYWFAFERTKTKNQNKFLLQRVCWYSFLCASRFYIRTISFSIHICDLFFENSDIDIPNYVDDNTPYACSSDLDSVIFKLQKNTERILRWFRNNHLISNAEKSHLEKLEIQVSSCSIRNENSVKLLGIYINNNLSFDYHVNQLCKTETRKIHALARIPKYMDININKRRMLFKAFASSQFSYCPLIWMFHSRKMEHRINSLHNGSFK